VQEIQQHQAAVDNQICRQVHEKADFPFDLALCVLIAWVGLVHGSRPWSGNEAIVDWRDAEKKRNATKPGLHGANRCQWPSMVVDCQITQIH
jgi:hypothetical protein